MQRFYEALGGINLAPGLVRRTALRDPYWHNMPRLMERFGVTVGNGEAPALAARGDEAPAVIAREIGVAVGNGEAPAVAARGGEAPAVIARENGVAVGNGEPSAVAARGGEAPAVAARDDAGDSEAVADERSIKRKRSE